MRGRFMGMEHLQNPDVNRSHELAPMDLAQSCTLLYRRIAFCRPSPQLRALGRCGGLPIANRRYSRVQLCATVLRFRESRCS